MANGTIWNPHTRMYEAIDDRRARGLDAKYPNEEDAKELASTINGILDHTVKELFIATGHECWKNSGEACYHGCKGLCKNSCWSALANFC